MKINTKLFLSIWALTLFCCVFAYGQNEKSNEPVLTALTEEEKKLDAKSIIANQPDFTADESYFSARSISGFSATGKVARKGKKYRYDTGFVVVISEPNKPSLRLYENKTFEEGMTAYSPRISPTSPLNPTDLLSFSDISFTALGTIEIDGKKCLKIEAKSKEFSQQVFLYAALQLKNLIIAAQVISPERSGVQRLRNISFNVPDSLFDLSDYKALPKHKWDRVSNAKVFYDGKPVKNSHVFRSPQGYLFVALSEPHPATGLMLNWHYLIRPQEKTVEVAFQGLLVTKDGKFAWRSDSLEAFSTGEIDSKIDTPTCEDKNCPKVAVSSNSVIFPSVYYEDRKSLVKVTW